MLWYFIIQKNINFSINFRRMGCDESVIHQNITRLHQDSSLSEDDIKLDLQTIIERQRGNVLQLYHFSKILSRQTNIIRKVLERNSRINRICKIKAVQKQILLISAFQQASILKNLNHPNIVQIIEYFHYRNYLYLMLEEIPGQTLHQMYCEPDFNYLQVIVDIIKQILIALNFCHQKGYAHKNITPQHIKIVKLQKQYSYLVKLIGFGHAQQIGANKLVPSIIAPNNIFTAPQADHSLHAQKLDIWGCGIIFLELVCGEHQFPNFLQQKNQIINHAVDNQNLNTREKQVITDFLIKMLETDPSQRLTAENALKHPLFQISYQQGRCLREKVNVMQKLLRFRVESNLKALFTMYASVNILSVPEKSEYLLEFYTLDTNKDGKIDFNELVQGLENTFNVDHQHAEDHVRKIFEQSNKSEECSLEFHEYVAATTFMQKEIFEKTLGKVFDEIDTNKDSIISVEELTSSLGEINIREILREFGEQQITFQKFRTLMLTLFERERNIIALN